MSAGEIVDPITGEVTIDAEVRREPTQPPRLDKIGKALMAARAEFTRAVKDSQNPHLKKRFASLSSVLEASNQALSAHGLTFTQPTVITPAGTVLRTILIHTESGQTIESEFPLLFNADSRLNPMQAIGSALTYARRYSIESLLGILREDDDVAGAYPLRDDRPAQAHRSEPRQQQQQQRPAPAQPTNGGGAFRDWCKEQAAIANDNPWHLLNFFVNHLKEQGIAVAGDWKDNPAKFAGCERLFLGHADWKAWFEEKAIEFRAKAQAAKEVPA